MHLETLTMKNLLHNPTKNHKQFLFEVQLSWLEEQKGILQATDVNEIMHVATPKQFGGTGEDWSPEHLFLGAVNSCYMSTLFSFAKKMNLNILAFECNSIGQIEMLDGKYRFTFINMYPTIGIAKEEDRVKANLAVEKTQQYCLVSNSLSSEIIYHTEIVIKPYSVCEVNDGVL